MIPRIDISLRVVEENSRQLSQALRLVAQEEVLVGVPSEKAPRRAGKINNAALAYIHDQGCPAANIPARPFLGPGILEGREKIVGALEATGQLALAGGTSGDVERALHRVGSLARDAVRNKINTGPFKPLRPATLAARRRRGFKGTKPLIRGGELRNSINYVVRRVVLA